VCLNVSQQRRRKAVARINQELLQRLEKKLGIGRRRTYDIIEEKVCSTHLPRHLAAIAVASENGVNISRFAKEDDLAAIRSAPLVPLPQFVGTPAQEQTHPRARGKVKKQVKSSTVSRRRGNTVFVVHGRNEEARKAMFSLLRALGLKPIEWSQAIKKTGESSPYVGTILEIAFREAAAVVVLLTPDDEARLKKKYRKPQEPNYERKLTGQARPNVLFEAGMAFGRNPNSTVLVQLGNTRPFSDVAGRHLVHLTNNPASRQELATKLENAGCNIDTSGTDWLSIGNFSF
jgi:predicted nucleotide-binding protein